jgi:hypothetical protein
LNDRLTGLRNRLERGDAAPTAAYRRVYAELSVELAETMQALEVLFTEGLSRLNTELNRAGLPRVVIRDRLITE